MDTDCLVKLTKAGAKEAVLAAMNVHVPPLVKKEAVDQAKVHGHQDAIVIEDNLARGRLHVVEHGTKRSRALVAARGEEDVLALYRAGRYDAVASDDRRFLKRLEAAGVPFVTSAACLAYLAVHGHAAAPAVLALLESLRPFISHDEYVVTLLYLKGRR